MQSLGVLTEMIQQGLMIPSEVSKPMGPTYLNHGSLYPRGSNYTLVPPPLLNSLHQQPTELQSPELDSSSTGHSYHTRFEAVADLFFLGRVAHVYMP